MLRGLYRFYLYAVFIAMVLFAAFAMQGLLQTMLALTIFETSYRPSEANVVQAVVLAVVAMITALLLGGLHYWLIRRDMRNDSTAGNGAVRAFFLNSVELSSLPSAVAVGAFTLAGLGSQNMSGASYGAAYTLTFLGVWALIEWERRRAPASTGVAGVFQRLHVYGVQLSLLFIVTGFWFQTVGLLVDELLFGGRGSGIPLCAGFSVCQSTNLLSQITGTVWVMLFWLGYGWLSRHDITSLLRKVVHFLSFGYGMIVVLVGVYRAVSLLLLFSFFKVTVQQSSISGPFAAYDVLSPVTLGLLTVGVYLFWLRRAADRQIKEQQAVFLTALSIVAALLAVSFWWGCGVLLLNTFEKIAPSPLVVKPEDWAAALAFGITGIGYVPLDMLLRRWSKQAAYAVPLRGFVLTLLGGGILAGAIGGATALYAYGTSLLGSPPDNWQYVAHAGLAAFIVGLALVALYLWTSIHEGFFHSSTKEEIKPALSTEDTTEAPAISPSPVAGIVDNLLAGKITRDEAVAQIEQVVKQTV